MNGFLALLLIFGAYLDNAPAPAAAQRPTKLSDLTLAELAERLQGEKPVEAFDNKKNAFEPILLEIVRRNRHDAEKLLLENLARQSIALKAAELREENVAEDDVGLIFREFLFVRRLSQNLELVTALRRVQGNPDPLSIEVRLPTELKASTRTLPEFTVLLTSSDVERIPVWTERPNYFGTNRAAGWRFEVTTLDGIVLQTRPRMEKHIHISRQEGLDTLKPGESLWMSLPMGDFVRLPRPGKYTVTILYHNRLPIADITNPDELRELILFRSKPFTLTVEQEPRRVIQSTLAERSQALALVEQLPDKDLIKIIEGEYDKPDYAFIPPDTPQGRLLTMNWSAVPGLLAALSDDKLSAHRKAWVLSLLYTITPDRDLDPVETLGALPSFATLNDGRCINRSFERRISVKEQQHLIEKWKVFEQECLEIQEHDGH